MLNKRDKFFARKTVELWSLEDEEWYDTTGKAITSSRRSSLSGYQGIFRNSNFNWDLAYSLGKKNCSFSNFKCFV